LKVQAFEAGPSSASTSASGLSSGFSWTHDDEKKHITNISRKFLARIFKIEFRDFFSVSRDALKTTGNVVQVVL